MNKINFIIYLIFFITFSTSIAQVDSLSFYFNNKSYKKALIIGEKLENDLRLRKDFRNLAATISNNAIMYNYLGDFIKAKGKFDECLKICNDENGISSIEKAIVKKQAARNLKDLNDYESAKKLVSEAIEVFKHNLFHSKGDYADALRLLGDIYRKEGNPEISLKFLFESAQIFNETFGETEFYSFSLMSLGQSYLLMGDLKNAELYLIKSIEIQKKFDKKSKDYFKSLVSLSDIYFSKYDYIKTQSLLYEAYDFFSQDDLFLNERINILERLFDLYYQANLVEDAEIIMVALIELVNDNYNYSHPNSKSHLNRIGLLYLKQGKFEDAKNIYIDLTSITKIDNDTAAFFNNFAMVLSELGEYSDAEKTYLDVIDFFERKKNSNETYNRALLNLSNLYIKTNQTQKLKNTLLKQQVLSKQNILNYTEFFTVDDLLKHLYYNQNINNLPLHILNISCFHDSIDIIAIYETQLLLKSLTLRNQERIKQNIESSGSVEVKEKHKQFINNSRYLSKLEELPQQQRPANFEELKTDNEILEKELIRLSSAFAESKSSLNINWHQIQKQLKPQDVLIDFVSFQYFNKKWTDSILYAAFVIHKESKFPKYIPLFEEKQLTNAIQNRNSNQESAFIDSLYISNTLRELFFKPLENELKQAKNLYFVPSGLIHQINLGAIAISENQLWRDVHSIHYLGSASSLLNLHSKPHKLTNTEIILYGGIDYNKKSNQETEQKLYFDDLVTRSSISEFSYLIGSEKEVLNIANLANQSKLKHQTFTERNATETSFKSLDGKKQKFVLHIATHGYFFENIQTKPKEFIELLMEDSKQFRLNYAEDPMLRSGLIFAGANKYWGNSVDSETSNDGIITAKDISNLDLRNCELVVLSACETGLGEVNGSEGVFGLQRAFKMAGVSNIIMSLWKIPDAQTAELFEIFYASYFNGKSIADAFYEAQNQMKLKYSPYFWAGFVLLE